MARASIYLYPLRSGPRPKRSALLSGARSPCCNSCRNCGFCWRSNRSIFARVWTPSPPSAGTGGSRTRSREPCTFSAIVRLLLSNCWSMTGMGFGCVCAVSPPANFCGSRLRKTHGCPRSPRRNLWSCFIKVIPNTPALRRFGEFSRRKLFLSLPCCGCIRPGQSRRWMVPHRPGVSDHLDNLIPGTNLVHSASFDDAHQDVAHGSAMLGAKE